MPGKNQIKSNAEIGRFDVVIAEETLTCSLIDDLSGFEYISSVGNQKSLLYILFDDEDGRPFLIDLFYGVEDIPDQERGESEGGFIKHLKLG